jgi:hypothetical protein
MKLIIDCVIAPNGIPGEFMYFDTGAADDATTADPTGVSPHITALAWLSYMNDNPAVHAKAGWDVPSNLPGTLQGTTRWQALVAQANGPTASAAIKALGLK